MLESPAEYHWMAGTEQSLWWYRCLHTLAGNALMAHCGARDIRVLDAGCGTGGLMQHLNEIGFRHVEGFDISPWAVDACHARGLVAQIEDLRNLHHHTTRWDAIVSNDTLCFFAPAERFAIVQSMAHRLNPEGLLILNVPALSVFRGRHDSAVGIVHRSSRSELKQSLEAAGLQILQLRFWPFLLSPVVLAVRLIDRFAARLGYPGPRPETRIPPRRINNGLQHVVQWELRHLQNPPWGSSLFAVASKSVRH